MTRFLLALTCLICAGCFDNKTPPPPDKPTAVTRLDTVMKDTADDLELGAKIRLLVDEQRCRRQLRPRLKHEYGVTAILYGVAFVIGIGIIHRILNSDKKA